MKPILIVDDEAAIAELIRRTLAGAGYDCVAVTDGAAAADLLEREAFDLVLLDIMMPGVDGYDLLRWLRPGGMPVVFITAKGTTADKVKGLHMGADDYIVKPFDPAELVARVESVLRRAGGADAPGVRTAADPVAQPRACALPQLPVRGGLGRRGRRRDHPHAGHPHPAPAPQARLGGQNPHRAWRGVCAAGGGKGGVRNQELGIRN